MSKILEEDKLVLLQTLILSPAYSILKEIAQGEIDVAMRQLEDEKDVTRIFHTQGRIKGLRSLQNLPGFLAIEKKKRFDAAKRREGPAATIKTF